MEQNAAQTCDTTAPTVAEVAAELAEKEQMQERAASYRRRRKDRMKAVRARRLAAVNGGR